MKKLVRNIILIVFLLILVGAVSIFYFYYEQEKIIQSLEDRIDFLKETSTPLRFMLLPSDEGTITARFRFYSADGKELSVFEENFPGEELVIDSMLVPAADKYIAFPTKIFTDAIAPKDGMPIFRFYNFNGVPEIHSYDGLDTDTRQLLSELFLQVMKIESINNDGPIDMSAAEIELMKKSFGNAVHDIKTIKTFEKGRVYALVIHTKGGIEIIEE
jgi:hypothetical protein